MKSFWIKTEGGKTALELREVETPEPGPGEIAIRIRAAGLNRGEIIVGGVMHGGAEKPGGTEAAGEIIELGDGVEGWQTGDRVMGRVLGRGGGAFSEVAVMPVHQAMRVPECLSWEEAAAIPVSQLAAYDAVIAYGGLKAGEWLLVTAASSAVGVASLQIGRVVGAQSIGTSGSAAKLERLEAAGMNFGIETRAPDFAARVREITGGGADLAVNCLGGSVFEECMASLRFGGRIATVGYMDGVYRSEIDLQTLHRNRHVVFGISNSRLSEEGRAATVTGFVRDILPAFADGRVAPLIDRVFPFEDLPAAKAHMESDTQVGKIVVRMA